MSATLGDGCDVSTFVANAVAKQPFCRFPVIPRSERRSNAIQWSRQNTIAVIRGQSISIVDVKRVHSGRPLDTPTYECRSELDSRQMCTEIHTVHHHSDTDATVSDELHSDSDDDDDERLVDILADSQVSDQPQTAHDWFQTADRFPVHSHGLKSSSSSSTLRPSFIACHWCPIPPAAFKHCGLLATVQSDGAVRLYSSTNAFLRPSHSPLSFRVVCDLTEHSSLNELTALSIHWITSDRLVIGTKQCIFIVFHLRFDDALFARLIELSSMNRPSQKLKSDSMASAGSSSSSSSSQSTKTEQRKTTIPTKADSAIEHPRVDQLFRVERQFSLDCFRMRKPTKTWRTLSKSNTNASEIHSKKSSNQEEYVEPPTEEIPIRDRDLPILAMDSISTEDRQGLTRFLAIGLRDSLQIWKLTINPNQPSMQAVIAEDTEKENEIGKSPSKKKLSKVIEAHRKKQQLKMADVWQCSAEYPLFSDVGKGQSNNIPGYITALKWHRHRHRRVAYLALIRNRFVHLFWFEVSRNILRLPLPVDTASLGYCSTKQWFCPQFKTSDQPSSVIDVLDKKLKKSINKSGGRVDNYPLKDTDVKNNGTMIDSVKSSSRKRKFSEIMPDDHQSEYDNNNNNSNDATKEDSHETLDHFDDHTNGILNSLLLKNKPKLKSKSSLSSSMISTKSRIKNQQSSNVENENEEWPMDDLNGLAFITAMNTGRRSAAVCASSVNDLNYPPPTDKTSDKYSFENNRTFVIVTSSDGGVFIYDADQDLKPCNRDPIVLATFPILSVLQVSGRLNSNDNKSSKNTKKSTMDEMNQILLLPKMKKSKVSSTIPSATSFDSDLYRFSSSLIKKKSTMKNDNNQSKKKKNRVDHTSLGMAVGPNNLLFAMVHCLKTTLSSSKTTIRSGSDPPSSFLSMTRLCGLHLYPLQNNCNGFINAVHSQLALRCTIAHYQIFPSNLSIIFDYLPMFRVYFAKWFTDWFEQNSDKFWFTLRTKLDMVVVDPSKQTVRSSHTVAKQRAAASKKAALKKAAESKNHPREGDDDEETIEEASSSDHGPVPTMSRTEFFYGNIFDRCDSAHGNEAFEQAPFSHLSGHAYDWVSRGSSFCKEQTETLRFCYLCFRLLISRVSQHREMFTNDQFMANLEKQLSEVFESLLQLHCLHVVKQFTRANLIHSDAIESNNNHDNHHHHPSGAVSAVDQRQRSLKNRDKGKHGIDQEAQESALLGRSQQRKWHTYQCLYLMSQWLLFVSVSRLDELNRMISESAIDTDESGHSKMTSMKSVLHSRLLWHFSQIMREEVHGIVDVSAADNLESMRLFLYGRSVQEQAQQSQITSSVSDSADASDGAPHPSPADPDQPPLTAPNEQSQSGPSMDSETAINFRMDSLERCPVCGRTALVHQMHSSICGQPSEFAPIPEPPARRIGDSEHPTDATNEDDSGYLEEMLNANRSQAVQVSADSRKPETERRQYSGQRTRHLLGRCVATFSVMDSYDGWHCPGCNGGIQSRFVLTQVLPKHGDRGAHSSASSSLLSRLPGWFRPSFSHVPPLSCPICGVHLFKLV